MKTIFFLLGLLLIFNSLVAQTSVKTFTIKSSDTYNGNKYDYQVTIKYQMFDGGYGNSPTALKVGFSNFQITEVYYNGKRASSYLNNINFPVSKKLKANLNGRISVSKGSVSMSYSFNEGWVSDGALDTYDLPSTDRNKIFSLFGKDITCNDIKINMNSAKVSDLGDSFIGSIIDEMKKQTKVEKKQKYNKEIKKETVENNRTNSQNKEKEVNVNNSTYNNLPKETIYQKRQREAREAENKEIIAQKKREEEVNRILRQQEQKLERKKAENELIVNTAANTANWLASGIADGAFKGFELSANLRTDNSDDVSFGVAGNSTYELAVVVGAEGQGYFSLGYGPAEKFIYDSASGGVFVLGIEFDILKSMKTKPGKYDFRIAIGGEYGSGTIEYEDESYSGKSVWTDEGYYYGGHVSLKLFEFIVFKYGLGAFSGETNKRTDNEELSGGYSKYSAGLRFTF